MSAAGVPTIKLTPLEAYADSTVTVYHEIGEATSPGNVSLGFYYVRWQQNDDGVVRLRPMLFRWRRRSRPSQPTRHCRHRSSRRG